jgi:D-hydroxyproline dehydrogenase subunit alpha
MSPLRNIRHSGQRIGDPVDAMNERFDILVVGAGPAGIAAAVSAAGSGQRVGLVDDNPAPGGQIWRKGAHLPPAAQGWLAKLDASAVVRLDGWRAFDHPERGVLRAERNSDCADLSYQKLILATGARELFLPFPGWTLPNVMGAGGLDAMVRSGLAITGRRVVVAGTGPLLLAVAAHLAGRGARILAICEQAALRRVASFAAGLVNEPAKLLQGIGYRFATLGTRFHARCWPVAASGTEKLECVTLRQGRERWEVACDYLACGFHLVPNVELAALLGCRIEGGFIAIDELQQTSVPDVFCAGEPTGIGGVDLSLLEGQIAGMAATGRIEEAQKLAQRRIRMLGFVRALRGAFRLDPQLRSLASDETLVCRCEDVPYAALRSHASWRDAKLHTRCGMGPCQGRICGAATEFLFGWGADSIRPPVFPVLLSSLAATNIFSNSKEIS